MNAVIATTPQGMIAAQPKLLEWCDARLKAVRYELTLAEQTFNSLQRAKMRTQSAGTQIRKARQRISFYEKVAAAIKLGYYIVPPFELQIFAIRTDRAPLLQHSERNWVPPQDGQTLPAGKGSYVNPVPTRYNVGTIQKENYDKSGTRDVAIYENADEFNGIDLPVRAQKPEIIDAVQGALEAKIFDALGIAPGTRAADPIICGQIRRPERFKAPLTFFVAWWLDQSDL